MILKNLIVAIGLAVTAFAGVSNAAPVTFIHTGIGSGTIGATSFTNAPFTITEIGNTASVQDCTVPTALAPCFFVNDLSASVSISALGIFNILTPTRTFVDQDLLLAGFGLSGPTGQDIFDGPNSPLFANYDLATSIGPVTGFGSLVQNQSLAGPLSTSGGDLLFVDSLTPATFQATIAVIPEPSTLFLVALVLPCLAIRRKTRK